MDVCELFYDGMTDADIDRAFKMMQEQKLRFERTAGQIRPLAYLAAEVSRHDLATFNGIGELKVHVSSTWTCREIDYFRSFLHGGSFRPDSGKWVVNFSGISTRTYKEDRNLESVWRNLLFFANAFIGAAAALGLKNSRIEGPAMMTDEGDDPTLWDMTIYELAHMVADARKSNIGFDISATLKELHDDVKVVKAAVEVKIPSSKDCAVSVAQLSEALERLGVKKGVRIIQKWEQFLRGDTANGTKPPLGYSLSTRISLPSAMAWAKSYAAVQSSRLRTKISFEALTGGRG